MERPTAVMTRRTLLAAGAASLGGLLACRYAREAGPASAEPPPPGGLVIRNPRPLDAEAPLAELRSFLTPNEHFFVRSHFGPPASLPAQWTLTIDGAVRRPTTFSLDEIRRMGGRRSRSLWNAPAMGADGSGCQGQPACSGSTAP